jgi:hypothetical protein
VSLPSLRDVSLAHSGREVVDDLKPVSNRFRSPRRAHRLAREGPARTAGRVELVNLMRPARRFQQRARFVVMQVGVLCCAGFALRCVAPLSRVRANEPTQ